MMIKKEVRDVQQEQFDEALAALERSSARATTVADVAAAALFLALFCGAMLVISAVLS